MADDNIRESIENAKQYLSEHPGKPPVTRIRLQSR